MRISVSNGSTTARVESIGPNVGTNGTWVQHSVLLSSLLTVTNTMQVSVEVEDNSPGNIVEGALDQFEILGQLINTVPDLSNQGSIGAYPNPFSNNITISYDLGHYNGNADLSVKDVLGRLIMLKTGLPSKGKTEIGSDLSSGVYVVEISNGENKVTKKIVKH
jgi:hypothetical protein